MGEQTGCEYCSNYQYDEDLEEWVCDMDLDEDEIAGLLEGRSRGCPFFRFDDEYQIVKKQM